MIGDEEVADRAPIVDLWIKQARRNGAEVVRVAEPGLGDELEQRVSASDRAVLIWSGRAGGGGARLAELGHRLGLEGKPGCAAFSLPSTPNGRGVADAWAAAGEGEEENPEPIGLLIVSGDEAASDPAVRALAEQAEHVIAITMFHGLAVGWADLVLPGTSYLERDGSYLNLEGRLQRLRRTVIPPVPDELAWLAKLAERFDVELSPHASAVFAELSGLIYGGIAFGEVGERAPLPDRAPYEAPAPAPVAPVPPRAGPARRALPRHARSSSATGRSSPARPWSASPSSRSSGPSLSSSWRSTTRSAARWRTATPSASAPTGRRSSCALVSAARWRPEPHGSPRSTPPISTARSRW